MKFIMIFNDFSIVDFFNEVKSYCYKTYKIILIFQNFWNHTRIFTNIFYVIDKNEKIVSVTLKLLDLIKKHNYVLRKQNLKT